MVGAVYTEDLLDRVFSRFRDEGEDHTVVVRWGAFSRGGFPVTLELDGVAAPPVRVPLSNRSMSAVPMLVPVAVVAAAAAMALLLDGH